jgi:phosphoribosylformylglycinamidine cyclo-ligase
VLEASRWPRPAIFDVLQRLGAVERSEMYDTFNMGLGMTAVVAAADADAALAVLAARGVAAWDVGGIEAGVAGREAEAVIQ